MTLLHLPLRVVLAFSLALWACAGPGASRPRAGAVAEGTLDSENIVLAREKGQAQGFAWAPWSKESFERAQREHRFVLVDGAAEWCHWCHVMDETTYRDPEVGRLLRERFVAIRVDVDARPDIAERYAEWGWPATILLSPDAEELGKFRGYLPPERLLEILHDLEARDEGPAVAEAHRRPGAPLSALGWISERVARDLDAAYDADEGGWGKRRKVPMGMNLVFELHRAARGDAAALERARFTLSQQRALIDPVWGGIYQYSAAKHWKAPHFEKLMKYQAPALEAYARAYALTRDDGFLEDAQRLARYMTTFLAAPDGTFYANQDADLNAHTPGAPFVDGHVYYALGDAERRKLGLPWVDTHVYAETNGLAIQALCAMNEATGDAEALARAQRAADALAKTHVLPDGTVRREASRSGPYYLADAAALGLGYARLALRTGEARPRELALRIGQRLVDTLRDEATGAYWDHTADPDGVGVFSRRRQSLPFNVRAARLFTALARLTGDGVWSARARQALAGVASPKNLDDEGAWLGEFLLALDEATVAPSEPSASARASGGEGRGAGGAAR